MKNNIRELRASLNYSQAKLAAIVEVSRQTIISIEKGHYDPSLPLAFKIANAFGKSLEEIFSPEV